jgi:transposase-like protein
MGMKLRVDPPEEKRQIVQEGIKSCYVFETCRRYGIAQTLYYRWEDEGEYGAKAALGGEAMPRPKPRRTGASGTGTNAGAEVAGDRNPKKRREGVICSKVHSQARKMVTRGYTATLVAATLEVIWLC